MSARIDEQAGSQGPPLESPTLVTYEKRRPLLVLRSAVLCVVKGLDQHASCTVDRHRVGIGTAPDNDLVLTDPLVSRHHLELQVRDQGYMILDLGSTNGTYFRGARIREAFVGAGMEFRLGETILRLDRGPEHTSLIEGRNEFGGLIGTSAAMQQVYGVLAAVAPTDATVLIEGETGTGKEIVAEELHRQSPRRNHLFSVVDCGAMPANLIESELYGHERGAFTGAVSAREGIFEKTRGGTVFLDEIGELPLELQTRLLRVLDRRCIRRLGSNIQRKVDVRLVAATNRTLEEEIRQGNFRQDLFYRLSVVRLILPPLRKRREDIPLLARHFLWQAGCAEMDHVLTPEVLEVLSSRSWPGNVRELRNIVERALVFADGLDLPAEEPLFAPEPSAKAPPTLAKENAPSLAAPGKDAPAAKTDKGEDPRTWLSRTLPRDFLRLPYKKLKVQLLEQLEELYLDNLFQLHGRNISRIAQDAGLDRHRIRKLLRKHGMLVNDPSP